MTFLDCGFRIKILDSTHEWSLGYANFGSKEAGPCPSPAAAPAGARPGLARGPRVPRHEDRAAPGAARDHAHAVPEGDGRLGHAGRAAGRAHAAGHGRPARAALTGASTGALLRFVLRGRPHALALG